ncbi:MAG: hypothetical protein R3301_19240, partial [Saprospiraceae bacterium]|nr:hypothetical protein [Saprospiraceae bacterium]
VQRFKDRNWKKDWVIVNEVVEAESGTVIISDSKDGKIEIKANAQVNTLSDDDLGNAELGLSVAFKKGVGYKVVGKRGMTPLFRCVGIKRRALVPKAPGAPDPFEEMLDNGQIFEAHNDVEE